MDEQEYVSKVMGDAEKREALKAELKEIAASGKVGAKEAQQVLDDVRDTVIYTHQLEATLHQLKAWIAVQK